MVLLLRAATIESGYKRKEMVVCVCFDAPPPKLYCNFAKGKRTARTTRVGIRVGPWLSSCRHGVQHTNTKICWLVSTNNQREGFFSPLSYSYLVDKEDHRLEWEQSSSFFSLLISHFNNFLQSNETSVSGGQPPFSYWNVQLQVCIAKKEWSPTYMSVPLSTYCLRLGSRSQVPDSLQQMSLGALNFCKMR